MIDDVVPMSACADVAPIVNATWMPPSIRSLEVPMRSVLVALLALLPATALAERSYRSEKGVTHDCAKEPEIVINDGGGTYTFTGPCTKLLVNGGDNKIKAESVVKILLNGAKNTIEVDAVDKLAVNGSDNTVTYKRGVNGKPKVTAIGSNNKLNQVK
jgi:DUF3060 family protein